MIVVERVVVHRVDGVGNQILSITDARRRLLAVSLSIQVMLFLYFFPVTGPRRFLSLKLSYERVYEP